MERKYWYTYWVSGEEDSGIESQFLQIDYSSDERDNISYKEISENADEELYQRFQESFPDATKSELYELLSYVFMFKEDMEIEFKIKEQHENGQE